MLFTTNDVININIIKIIITDINEEIVFILVPFKKNKIIELIIRHIINVGIVGLNPQPTINTNININARFM